MPKTWNKRMSKMNAQKNARGTLQSNEEIFKIKKQAHKQTFALNQR